MAAGHRLTASSTASLLPWQKEPETAGAGLSSLGFSALRRVRLVAFLPGTGNRGSPTVVVAPEILQGFSLRQQ